MEKSLFIGKSFEPFAAGRSQRRARSFLAQAQRQRCNEIRHDRQELNKIAISLAGLVTAAPAWARGSVQDLQQKASELPSSLPSSEQISGAVQKGSGGGIFDLFADNPILLGGLALLAAVPFLFSFIQGGSLGVKQVNATGAVEGLTNDPSTVLLDIRNRTEIKEQGVPNLASTKKKAILLPFTQIVEGEVEELESFAENFGKLRQIKPESSIILLDSFGQDAPKAAKLLANLVDRVYYVKDGAIGPAGWRESGEAWKEPGQNFLSGLSLDNLAEDFKAQPTVAKAGIAAGAIGLAGAVLFQEVGTALELAAVAAAGAVIVPRFAGSGAVSDALPADSETTKKQVKDFVKETSKDPARAVGKAERSVEQSTSNAADKAKAVASEATSEAQSAVDNDSASSSLKAKASQTQDKAENKAEEIVQDVQGGAIDAAKVAQESAEEAKEWIENWKKESKK